MKQAGGGSTRELTLENWPPTTASTSQAVNIQPTSRLVRRIDGVRAGPGERVKTVLRGGNVITASPRPTR